VRKGADLSDDLTPTTSSKTPGELLFEEYLERVGITDFEFERDFPESLKKPDYAIVHHGQLLLDLKDFRGEPKDFEESGFGPYDPYGPIREKINEGLRKFKDFKSYPCALVLYNHDKPLVTLRPLFVYAAMLGNLGFSFPVDTTTGTGDLSREKTVFSTGGKMIRYDRSKRPIEPQNTTISAVITIGELRVGQGLFEAWLKKEEQNLGRKMTSKEAWQAIDTYATIAPGEASRTELRVVVHHNPYARIKWPEDIFLGPWDEHYAPTEEGYIRRRYAGQALLEWEMQTSKTPDFPM
jgi:hypothetical protein